MTTTTSSLEATIEADPTLPIIRITRDFRATPAQVLRAHLDPELYARWVGPAPVWPTAVWPTTTVAAPLR